MFIALLIILGIFIYFMIWCCIRIASIEDKKNDIESTYK